MKTVETTTETIRDAVRSRVYLSDKLGREWEEQIGLYCDSLRLSAAPGIDQATLHYDYGPIRREETDAEFEVFEPLDIVGKYCKIVLEEISDDGDLTWYGVIEVADMAPHGSGQDEDEPRGAQQFTAYGLLRLLERVVILSSRVDDSQNSTYPSEYLTIEHGLDFNHQDKFYSTWQGNRTQYRQNNLPSWTFFYDQQRTTEHKWTSYEAAQYLLDVHKPVDGDDEPVCHWRLSENADLVLSWLEPQVKTDGRTAKAVLDDLISHRRGMSYRIEYTEDEYTRGTVRVVPFTFSLDDIEFPVFGTGAGSDSTTVLPKNDEQYELNFERGLDVEARVVDAITTGYDKVVAMGHFATSTCTLSFDPTKYQLKRDWTDDALSEYAVAASGDADYATLEPLQQMERNARYRAKDRLRSVLRRWKLYEWWNGLACDVEATYGAETWYYVNPPWKNEERNTDPECEPIQPYSRSTRLPGDPMWTAGTPILPRLALQDRSDYSGDKIETGDFRDDLADGDQAVYLPPLVFVLTDADEVTDKYELIDKLSDQSSNERIRRRWSASCHVLSEESAVEINVAGAPQHFLSSGLSPSLAQTDPFLDAAKEAGVNYEQMYGTFTLQLPWRVQQHHTITDEPIAGRQLRTLYLSVDARLDYVVPDTTVAIENGRPVLTDGGFVRDDRQKLANIAQAGAEWYANARQTLFLRVKGIVDIIPIGAMIATVGGRYSFENINTVVTAISFDLLNQETTIETSFAELEFS